MGKNPNTLIMCHGDIEKPDTVWSGRQLASEGADNLPAWLTAGDLR